MTVAELIEQLQEMPQDAEVKILDGWQDDLVPPVLSLAADLTWMWITDFAA